MRVSLRKKIMLMIVVLILACSLSYIAVSYFLIQKAVTVQMKNDGQTLVTTIKRELIQNNITDLPGMQKIFKEIKEGSNQNITYISLSDSTSKVFLTDDMALEQSGEEADAVSSATVGGDVVDVIKEDKISGNILVMPDGTRVYNVSTEYQYNGESSSLNIGISLVTMYSEIKNSMFDMGLISVIIMVIAIIAAIIPAEKLVKPITMISGNLKHYAEGDFRSCSEVKSRDEIGEMSNALNEMRLNLAGLVSGIKDNSLQVLGSAKELNAAMEETTLSGAEISKVAEEMTAGAADLAESSQTGLDKMSMLAERINSLYNNLEKIQGDVGSIQDASIQGNQSQRELTEQVNNNGEVITRLKEKIDILEGKLAAIGGMTSVIKAIADQTNLLAVNARIESARAGEQGRGFGVVAEEMGKLAEQTAESIGSIENITKEVEEAFASTLTLMEKGVITVNRTTEASKEAGSAFFRIETAIQDTQKQLKLITEDVNEVHSRKDEAVLLIGNISSVAQQSSAATEEITSSLECQNEGLNGIAHSTKELHKISVSLTSLIDNFKV